MLVIADIAGIEYSGNDLSDRLPIRATKKLLNAC